MALQPGNTSFVPGDLLTAQQYNITHNTVNKLAIEDNSRVVYPGSFPPANIASGHWVIAALAGNYSNYPGITSTSVLSPSVLVYDSSINEWDVYPLTGTSDSTIGIYNPSVQYKINDIVIYNDIDSVLQEYRHEYIYRCNEIAFPDQSPESNPSKWVRQGLYIDTDAITSLITSLDTRLTSVEIELTNKVNTSLLGANNGVATLDSQGKILTSQLPSLLINNTYVVNSEAEMLALLATKSDIAVRTDIEKTFILAEEPASNINNWIEVLASYDRVISVNGLGGVVTLTTSNIPEGSNLYFSDLRVNNNTNVAANTAKRHDQVTIGTPNGLLLNGQELSLQKASITETGALSSEDWLTFNNKQDIILQGPVDSYYRGDKTWQALNTASVVETTNLYFTQSRVLNTSIGNFIEINVAITAGDSIATALNKLQTQVNNRIATVSKEQIEAALTGNITSHTHGIYLTDAPIDNKQYARKDGSWIEVEESTQGTLDHNLLTPESRELPNQHPIESITGLSASLSDLSDAISLEELNRQQGDSALALTISTETSNRESATSAEILARQNADLLLQSNIDAESVGRIAKDDSLQDQIFNITENSPVNQTRYLTRDQITLNAETFYQSKADKGINPPFEITTSITGTDALTANIVAQWVGVALTQPLELIDQITSLLIKARKNGTQRTVTLFAEFYDYTSTGVKTLKGTSSQVVLTENTTTYDLYFPIQAYLAAAGSRGLIVVKGFQTGTGASASIILSIEGDYYSRWSYTIPTAALLLQDTQIKSTQDLPAIGALSGATQKEVNGAQNDAIEELNGRVDDVEVRIEGLGQNSSAIIPYRKYFIDIINGDDSNDGLSSDTAFKSTAILNDLLPTIAVKSVEIVLIGPSGLSDFGRIEVKNPLCLNTLIVEGYRNYGDSDVSTIEVDIVALDEFWFGGVVTGTLERIGLIKNSDYWYATLKDITIWHSHNISLSYNIMTNVIFYYCSIYLNSIYSSHGARFQNCIIAGDINRLSPNSIENCLFKDPISVTQEDLYLLDSKITEAVNSIGTTIDDINGSIGAINSSIGAININNEEQDLLNANHEQRLDNAEAQLAGNQLTFAAIYGYYNFI